MPPILTPAPVEVQVSSLVELLKQQRIRAYQVGEVLGLNRRTNKLRIE